jgi:uncharacterized DUF497 family protein
MHVDFELEWDESKRLSNLSKHRLDFQDSVLVLGEPFLRLLARPAGDEVRYRAIGYVRQNLVAVIYTMRGEAYRIISMRKARDDERRLFHQAVHGR